jgi:hypothetical protein
MMRMMNRIQQALGDGMSSADIFRKTIRHLPIVQERIVFFLTIMQENDKIRFALLIQSKIL